MLVVENSRKGYSRKPMMRDPSNAPRVAPKMIANRFDVESVVFYLPQPGFYPLVRKEMYYGWRVFAKRWKNQAAY